MNALAEGQTARLYFEVSNSLKSTAFKTDGLPLQSAYVCGFRRRLAVLSVSGGALPEVRWQPASASRLLADWIERRWRRVDLDSRGLGRRGAHRACAGGRFENPLSAAS